MKLFNRGKDKPKQTGQQQTVVDTGTGAAPDYQRMMRIMAGDAKGHALGKLLKSDEDNAVKANIHNVFNMSVMDAISHWEEFESEDELLQMFLNGRTGQMEGGYRINTMAEDGTMTVQYVEGFKAWTLIGGVGQAQAPSTIKEGDRK